MDKKLRLFLIIGEDHFYHPRLIDNLIKTTKDQIVGAALVVSPPKKADLQNYLLKHIYYLTPIEIIKLAAKLICSFLNHNAGSVKKVFEKNRIDFFIVEKDINKSEYIEMIKNTSPDIIVSSNPCIFKKEILALPNLCCINRHSSLLPSYGGLWPVWWAYTKGEVLTGVTIHTMDEAIDKGIVLSQKSTNITIKNSARTIAELYEITYKDSLPAILEAIDKLRMCKGNLKNIKPVTNNYKQSYFSFPAKSDWLEFRKRGGRFI